MKHFFDFVEANKLSEVRNLANDGFDINVVDKFGYSALHIACADVNLVSMAELLIDLGINVNIQDAKGATALHYVAEYGQDYLAGLLLKKGADLSIQDKYGNQPLWTATFNDKGFGRRFGMIKLFLDNGADARHKNNVGKSPQDIVLIAGYKNLESLFL